jgi:tRNA U34 5-methylaminomethyl-2-thiouridine-forming methyltransferase MnmC
MAQHPPNIQPTADGSHTLYSPIFDATYHSTHGAIQEAEVVFIHAALNYQLEQKKDDLSILEIGFGTGLNALMTYLATSDKKPSIYYEAWEAYPIGLDLAAAINYPSALKISKEAKDAFIQMHHSIDKIQEIRAAPSFQFQLRKDFFEAIDAQAKFDIIYQDAFSPNVQPELWEEHFLQKLYTALKPNGVLTTYCAKGAFKRALKSVGFQVEALPGPKGKREMTRAHKKS